MTRIKTTDIKRQLRIRIATPEDAARLVAIYAPYVENTSITFEYIVPSAEDLRIGSVTLLPVILTWWLNWTGSRQDMLTHPLLKAALLMTGLWRLPSMSAGIFEAAVSAVCYTKSWRNT